MLKINGRAYRKPTSPVVVICYDGCDPSYLADAFARRLSPTLARMAEGGYYASGLAAMPSFTNPNNISIVCGAPPSVHGISGNYWFDRETGAEVMMTDEVTLEAPTILATMAAAGVRVAAVTAKDKLRKALATGLNGSGPRGIAFSAQKAYECTVETNGISAEEAMGGATLPDQYSAELSLFVLDAGVRLLESDAADLIYLSLSDFVQHAYAPGAAESDDFIRQVDARVARLIELGATVGVVADHGMTDLSLADGTPNILYVAELLDTRFGVGRTRVICPITDPFVRHHGALGGFVRIHVLDDLPHEEVRDFASAIPGIHMALLRDEACRLFDLPPAREGDVTLVAAKGVALGVRRSWHNIDELAGARLRSHGSLAERDVPFIVSKPIRPEFLEQYGEKAPYNFDVFHFVLNGTVA
ncbi:phosphonoacetate hydrolase [Devosia sp.]|uniref:phosphonoacetate hydrolase n=1 Tax=Devosia sp. TaxID=1871048 RepID=UPI002F17C5DB